MARWLPPRIDTLRGVARRVVQRHPLEISLASGARLLDEEEAQALADLAVDEALGWLRGPGPEGTFAASEHAQLRPKPAPSPTG